LSELTAASIFAGDSSFGLESIEIMLRTILSTCKWKTINSTTSESIWNYSPLKEASPLSFYL
jgi:hypothetical protein